MAEYDFVHNQDRRTMRRYPCSLDVNFTSEHGNKSKVKCEDISSLGAGIVGRKEIPVGTKLLIKFRTKNEVNVPVEGKVRWCVRRKGAWRSGIAFNKLMFVPLDILV